MAWRRTVIGTVLLGLAAGLAPQPAWAPGPLLPADIAAAAPPVAVPAESADRAAVVGQARFAADFARFERTLSGHAGIVVVPVGGGNARVAGRWRAGVAWSTSKVPLAVAAERASGSAHTRRLVRRAITRSDNAAAERLWRDLGSGRRAQRAVQRVLRDAGDRRTTVEHRRVRPPFTAFGQTRWALADQARSAAGLACRRSARPVLAEMRHVTSSQRWGLGRLPRTAFKGGWGPVGRGYLVRQLGVLTLSDGRRVGVAIAIQAPSFERGTADLTRIARWLEHRLDTVPAGRCA